MDDETAGDEIGAAKPFSEAHHLAAKALWRCQVEAMGEEWDEGLLIPAPCFAGAAAMLEALERPTRQMIRAMVAPLTAHLPAGSLRKQMLAQAETAVTESWRDGIMAALGRTPEKPKAKPGLILLKGGHA